MNDLISRQPETHEERTETHACDLIDRQAAIDAFEALDWYHQNINKDMVSGANSDEHQAWYKADDVYKTIEEVPSAQPMRKKGKWVYGEDEYGIDGYHCDKCGFFLPWDYAHTFINYIEDYNFCPFCGADMREGGEDVTD